MGPSVLPGNSGGNNWSPISVDRKRKLAFVGAMALPVRYQIEKEVDKSLRDLDAGGLRLGGNWKFESEKTTGTFSAIDLTTGKIKWQNKSPMPYVGGVLSTSTGIAFQGEVDGNFTAFDSDSGEVLWRYSAGAGVTAPPISFELDGEQFIAVAAAGSALWSTPLGGTVLVFGLPKKWEAPAK